jgi:hypothetical protein
VRSPVNVVPRDLFGIPVLAVGIATRRLPARLADLLGGNLARAMIGDIEELGLRQLPYGPAVQVREHGRIPLLDIGTIDLIRRGRIAVRPGVVRFDGDLVEFDDGRRESFSAVVLATGYRPALDEFLTVADDVTNDSGVPRASGREVADGLYLCGFYVSPAGMLREIGIEAKRIARSIARAR